MKIRWQIAQAAEIRWWRWYLRKRNKGEYQRWKLTYWQQFLADLDLHPSPSDKVLDAGCGPAGIFMALEKQKVTAIDPLLPKYEGQLPHFTRADYPWVHFVPQALEELPKEETYDWIFCLNVINHVADLGRSLTNLKNALSENGCLILTVDAHNFQWAKPVFQLIPGDVLHPQQYDLEDYVEKVEKTGLVVRETRLLSKGFWFNYYALICYF